MMTGRELVSDIPELPNDVTFCAAMDQHRAGWSLFSAEDDDWGCKWDRRDDVSIGQVVGHPLQDWAAFDTYRPPDPRDPFYYDNAEPILAEAGRNYVVMTQAFYDASAALHKPRGT